MNITINNDLTVTIPNKQLFFKEWFISSQGVLEQKPDVVQIPIVRIDPGDGMMPRLGGMFFSSAVLTVNHDTNRFTIAQAKTKSAPSKLVAYDTKNNCVGEVKAAASSSDPKESSGANGGSNSNSNGQSSNSDGSSSSTKSTLSGGAIAGIVIGSLAAVALVLGAALVLIRRRRRRAAAAHQPSELAGLSSGSSEHPAEKYAYHGAEMYGDHGSAEMSGDNRSEMYAANGGNGYVHELDGAGRPHEVPAQGR
jgi:hypothetical protein